MDTTLLRLQIGSSAPPIDIPARTKWVTTGVLVAPGERYAFRAAGSWLDGGISTDPDGFPSDRAPGVSRWLLRVCEPVRRAPEEPWCCLIGCVGRDERRAFRIGTTRREWVAPTVGELVCFANDVWFAYGNNDGAVRLTIERLA